MINNLNIIESGSALSRQNQTTGQPKQRNWRHNAITPVAGPTAAPLADSFNYLIRLMSTLILNDYLMLSVFLMIFFLFMVFITCNVVISII